MHLNNYFQQTVTNNIKEVVRNLCRVFKSIANKSLLQFEYGFCLFAAHQLLPATVE